MSHSINLDFYTIRMCGMAAEEAENYILHCLIFLQGGKKKKSARNNQLSCYRYSILCPQLILI